MKTIRVDTTTTIRFIKPMYALAVQNIPDGKEWLYEVKFDGYRVLGWKRQERSNAVVASR